MLSYRHAFHAGNHADVLKHCTLLAVADYLRQKQKPFWYIDTHAGAGAYSLDSGYAAKNAEYENGIGCLWSEPAQKLPQLLQQYLKCIHAFNPTGRLRHYPGSPAFVAKLLAAQDQMRLFELHRSDHELLSRNFAYQDNVRIERADGFGGLKSVLPPQPRRALVLIDPSYEDKRDYKAVVVAMTDALKRFATGIYMIWYPLLQRSEAKRLPVNLHALGASSWLQVELHVSTPAPNGFGMYGSGLYIVNPPWTLPRLLADSLPVLQRLLKQDDSARFTLDHRIV